MKLDKLKSMGQQVARQAAEKAAKGASVAAERARQKVNETRHTRGQGKKADDEQDIVALDLGTEFVKALVARVVNGDEAEIIGVGRKHQALSDMQAGAIADIASVVDNCDQALTQAEEQAEHGDKVEGRDQASDIGPRSAQPGQIPTEREHDHQCRQRARAAAQGAALGCGAPDE